MDIIYVLCRVLHSLCFIEFMLLIGGGRGKFAIGASSPPTGIFRPVPLALSYVTIFEAAWLADVEKWHADDLNKT